MGFRDWLKSEKGVKKTEPDLIWACIKADFAHKPPDFRYGRNEKPPFYTDRLKVESFIFEPKRHWIKEGHWHSDRIAAAIKVGQFDIAWGWIHEMQEWCIERANLEKLGATGLQHILQIPRRLMNRIIRKQGNRPLIDVRTGQEDMSPKAQKWWRKQQGRSGAEG